MNDPDAILNDQARAFAKRRQDGITVLTQSKRLAGSLRRAIWKLLGRPKNTVLNQPKSESERLRKQLMHKTARQLIKMQRRARIEVGVERRRYALNLPKIIEGVLPTNLPAVRFLESRVREIEREMACRGMTATA